MDWDDEVWAHLLLCLTGVGLGEFYQNVPNSIINLVNVLD
jgi:hypothetical protein